MAIVTIWVVEIVTLYFVWKRKEKRAKFFYWLNVSHLSRCVHSSVNKTGGNGRVSYDSFTHSRLYWPFS